MQMTTLSMHGVPSGNGKVATRPAVCPRKRAKDNTVTETKWATVCKPNETPQPRSLSTDTKAWICHGCYLTNAHAANACARCSQRRPKTWQCFVCKSITTWPLSIEDPTCPHKACSLHCLLQLHPRWIDVKTQDTAARKKQKTHHANDQ